jgi:hypothetical protein
MEWEKGSFRRHGQRTQVGGRSGLLVIYPREWETMLNRAWDSSRIELKVGENVYDSR